MNLHNSIFSALLLLISGCSDYPTGYNEGYEGSNKNQWIVFGRSEYFNGYHSGQAAKFQDDWLLENPTQVSSLHCPTNIIPADPLMFLPAGYDKIAPDIYRSE